MVSKTVMGGVNAEANGVTALAMAAQGGNWRVFEGLIAAGAEKQHASVIKACSVNNHLKMLKSCLEAEAHSPTLSEGILRDIFKATCSAGHTECAWVLFEHAARKGLVDKVSGMIEEEMVRVAMRGHHWMILPLMRMSSDADTCLPEVLAICANNGDYRSVESLLETGMDPDADVEEGSGAITPLSIAAGHWAQNQSDAYFQTVVLLVSGGARLTSVDGDGRTLLMVAARAAKTELINLILILSSTQLGREGTQQLVDMQDKNGMTALMHAVKSFVSGTVLKLLKGGADADMLSFGDGMTTPPQMTALGMLTSICQRSAPDFLVALVSKTTKLMNRDENGNSFIMWAAKFDQVEAVQAALLRNTAGTLGINDYGEDEPSPLEVGCLACVCMGADAEG